MLFRVNFRTLILQLLPFFLRFPKLLRFLFSAVKPLQELNDDGVIVRDFGTDNPSFYQLSQFIDEFVAYDSRTIYLQKWLNNYYDPFDERIEIINNNNVPYYLFQLSEEEEPRYWYNQWLAATAYVVGNYVYNDGFIWVCIANSTGDEPPATLFWQQSEVMTYIYNDTDIDLSDFTVRVPIAVASQPDYSEARITSHVNLFNAAGTSFNIQIV